MGLLKDAFAVHRRGQAAHHLGRQRWIARPCFVQHHLPHCKQRTPSSRPPASSRCRCAASSNAFWLCWQLAHAIRARSSPLTCSIAAIHSAHDSFCIFYPRNLEMLETALLGGRTHLNIGILSVPFRDIGHGCR